MFNELTTGTSGNNTMCIYTVGKQKEIQKQNKTNKKDTISHKTNIAE